ncbi:MAG: sugar phosphate nucleotidyltransferase, partial [Bellilinea sp.]|nr:sugar phosphate nucleotidyltransferase [Bellilinea sp.]
RHITQTYHFDVFHTGWVQIWAAEQTMEHTDWYQGTADAVRKQLFQIRATRAEYVLILAGDHLYRMDYAAMFDFHLERGADITVAVQPVRKEDAGRFGILKRNGEYRITRFAEKPKEETVLRELVSRDDPQRPYLGSMGIYLFKTETLAELLEGYPDYDDFGSDVIPHAIETLKVYGYDFDGYWEDIGTIRSFYDTNLALAQPNSPFNFYDPQRPIYSHPRFLPGSLIENSHLENVLIAEGCCVKNARISNSVIGLRSQIRSGVQISHSVIMGADYYDTTSCSEPDSSTTGLIPLGIGRNSRISGAIIDKNARIGENVVIQPFPPGKDLDGDGWVVRDGIVVIPKDTVIPNDTRIVP